MIRLRKILLCNIFFYILVIVSLIFTFFRLNIRINSHYSSRSLYFVGKIEKFSSNGDQLILDVRDKSSEGIKGYYYFNSLKEKNGTLNKIRLGQRIKIWGSFSRVSSNTTLNTFNYRKYLERNNIFYSVNISKFQLSRDDIGLFYKIKNGIISYFSNFKGERYLKILILGISDDVSKKVLYGYRELGVSHLFAISGTQVLVVAEFLLFVFSIFKVSDKKKYFVVDIFIVFYLFITGMQAAILRSVLSFIISSINKIYYFHISSINIFYLVLAISLFINPNYIYDLGFQYSYLISFFLILVSEKISSNYFIGLLQTSIYSFFISIPITLYNFYQVNFLSIIYNLFFVPYVSYILFPLSFIVLFFPFLDFLLVIFINILESITLFLSNFNLFKVVFGKIPVIFYFLYFLLFILLVKFNKKIFSFIYVLLFLFHLYYFIIFPKNIMSVIDVGQGDSILIKSSNSAILIDTGGKSSYVRDDWRVRQGSSSIVNNTVIYMRSLGIRKIDLVLTHGDYDHLGDALTLIDNYNIGRIYLNQGNINYLEKKIVKKFHNTYQIKEGEVLNVNDIVLVQLNKKFNNENDSSSVFLMCYKNFRALLMGDASLKSEEYILSNYDVSNIDVIKLGHHGSSTSTGLSLLKETDVSLALISCGKNNKFNHPHKSVIDNLDKYGVNYLRTDIVGTITIDLDLKKIIR